jgi:hypothetical protein
LDEQQVEHDADGIHSLVLLHCYVQEEANKDQESCETACKERAIEMLHF